MSQSDVRIWRRLSIPDPVRIERYSKLPELGPTILFFSGGSALNKTSRVLKKYTHNSIHMVTPFDSGGSSAKLRDEFNMPAIGDLRSRIMALADETVSGQPDIFRLFNYRLHSAGSNQELRDELESMERGRHPLVACITQPMRELIQTQLSVTCARISTGFDLRGASIGNLIIAGGYLNNQQQLDPIVFLFSRLVQVQGEVLTINNEPLQLIAELENGERICGQHNLTGKEVAPITSAVSKVWLSRNASDSAPTPSHIGGGRKSRIEEADLICYPPGSFYSSVLANLLPVGVGEAVMSNPNPKVYVPNLGNDPEQFGMTLLKQVQVIARQVTGLDAPNSVCGAIDYLLLDKNTLYAEQQDLETLKRMGVTIIETDLGASRGTYDETRLSEALISLV